MRQRSIIALTSLALVLTLPATAGARGSGPVADATRAERARVLAYTPRRIASATWRDFVRDPGGRFVPTGGNPPSGGGTVR